MTAISPKNISTRQTVIISSHSGVDGGMLWLEPETLGRWDSFVLLLVSTTLEALVDPPNFVSPPVSGPGDDFLTS